MELTPPSLTEQSLTPYEEQVKDFLFQIFIPQLHHLLRSRNEPEYLKWGGNACRQTAVFGAYFLSKWLPDYEWTVWDGMFNDVIQGNAVTFDHAWLYGVPRQPGPGLYLDLSNVAKERLVLKTSDNQFPKDHPEYAHQEEIKRTKINWKPRIKDDIEHYTQLRADHFITLLERAMRDEARRLGIRVPKPVK